MEQIKSKNTFNKLILLIVIFLIGFISLFYLNQAFTKIINKLDAQTENLKAQITIGEFVAQDIIKIRSLFNELATTTSSKRSRALVKEEIDQTIKRINEALDILENGGTLKRMIALNIAGHLTTIKSVSYKRKDQESFSMESIDIKPKLNDLTLMLQETDAMLSERSRYFKQNDLVNYKQSIRKLRRHYKALPAFFNRMTENIRRLLYESSLELTKLESQITQDKEKYFKLKLLLVGIIITIVLVLGSTIARNINRANKELADLNYNLFDNINQITKQRKSIRAILDTQSSIVVVSDGKNIKDANQTLFDFLHQFSSLDEFKQKHHCICELFEDEIPDEIEYIQNKKYGELEWYEHIIAHPEIHFKTIITNNNIQHHFSVKVSKTVLDEKAEESVVIISLNDITGEIEDQKQLAELNENLESLVAKKTKELSELNENLEQRVIIESGKVREKDKMMMEQAKLASMGEMIGNIAHQWRQPLSVITSSASGLQMQIQLGIELSDQEIEDHSDLVVQQAKYLSHTIDHFRDFIKGDTSFGPISVIETLNNTLNLVDATLKSNHIQLIQNTTDDLIIEGNMNELTEAFINIINNSKDALKENILSDDEKFLFITTTQKDDTIEIEIKDNGGGIPEDILERIFEPYFTSKHQSVGTGLGLAMVDRIIRERHKGYIKVNNVSLSHMGKNFTGASICIVFPKIKE